MTRKIKVAHVVTSLELGGAQQNTLYTVKHLDRSRFEPFLVCGRGAILDAEASSVGAPVHFVPALVRSVVPWKDAAALAALTGLFRREKPDIVHTHSSKAGILGRQAAAWARVPAVVQTFHGFGFTPGQNPLARAFFAGLEKLVAPVTDAFIFVSRANLDEALGRGIGRPDKYHLIRSGVRLSDYRSIRRSPSAPEGLAVPAGRPLVVTIGPFKPQKNLGDFLKVAALVRRQVPEAVFLVVGDGRARPALEGEVRRLGLEGAVLLPGWRRDVPAVLARADVFAMTSLWEGLPRSLVEAMAAGLPSVANAVDGCRDIVADGKNGFLTPPGRPDLTAERIVRILKDPALARTLGAEARASIDDAFDIDAMVRAQEALYEGLLK